MKKITWEVQYHSLPEVAKHCKKCGEKSRFFCSEKFRVNAQRRALDVWLIYNCSNCNTTWNARVYSHISPQSINPMQLEGFHKNNQSLIKEYAMDSDFLYRNGVDEVEIPNYSIIGDDFLLNENVELEIRSIYPFPVKLSSLVRQKLHLSHAEYLRLIENKNIKSIPEQDLRKCKLKNNMTLVFQPK